MNKTPKLRFKEFSGEWESKQLSNYTEKITKKNKDFLVKNVISNSAKNGLVSQRDFFDKDIANQNNIDGYYIIENGDFVYNPRKSIESPYGPVNRYNLEDAGVVSPLYLCFKINQKINGEFLQYYFKSSKWYRFIYQNSDQGARHDRVSIKDAEFFKLDTKFPSLEEQEKIASFFSLIDKKISLQSEKVEMLKEYKKGMMQKIFSRELRFKDDSRIDYPEWKCMKLEEILTIPEKIKEENISKDKLLTVKLHRKGVHVNENTETLSIGSTVYYKRKAGQIIYGKQNFFNGAIAIIPKKFDGFISSGDVPALDVNNNVADSVYILNFIGRDTFYKRTEALATGTGSKRLHENILLDISIELPCIDEQKKIVDLLNKINEKLEKEQEKLDSLNEYKKGLLQQMFV